MTASALSRGLLAATFLVTAGLLLPGLAAASSVPAFAPPNPGNPAQQWAYGATWGTTGSVSGTATGAGGSFSYVLDSHAFLSDNVILTQTNTSATTFALEAQRTLVAQVDVEGCAPDCTHPAAQLNVTVRGVETDYGWANFTTQATVLLNGTSNVPAIAMENESVRVAGNLTAEANWTVRATVLHAATNGDAYGTSAANGNATIAFTPALALRPQTLGVGESWVGGTSAFTATGAYTKSCHAYDSNLGTASCGSSGTLGGSGTVSVSGVDTGFGIVAANNQYYPLHIVTLTFTTGLLNSYTFDTVDGILLIPHDANLYASSNTAVDQDPSGAGVSTATVNIGAGSSRGGFDASSSVFSSSVATDGLSSVSPVAPLDNVAASAVSEPGAQAGSWTVQSSPESVSQALSNENCVLNGQGCASSSASTPARLGGLVFLGVIVAAVAVVVVLVARRGRSPKRPAASRAEASPLPSPFRSGSAAPSAPPSGSSAPRPPPSQDPLGNLW